MNPVQNDFGHERQAILRGLASLNTFNLAVVCLIALLGLLAVWLAYKARQDAESLWRAAPLQARASRLGGENGWRDETLRTIAAASAVRPSLALRNEAIAALAAADLEPTGIWLEITNTHARFAYSSQLDYCAVGLPDGGIELFDFKKRRSLGRWQGPPGVVMLEFSPDDRYLAARFWRGELRVWSCPQMKEVLSDDLQPMQGGGLVHFSNSGLFVNVSLRTISSFDLEHWRPRASYSLETDAHSFAVSENGQSLVITAPGGPRVLDLTDGGPAKAAKTLPLEESIFQLAISPDGNCVAAGGAAQKIYLWNLRRGDRKVLAGHGGTIFHLRFSRDSARLASGAYGGTSRIWNASTGEKIVGGETVFATDFAADRQAVACYAVGRGTGIWRLKEAAICQSFAAPLDPDPAIHSIEFASDPNILLLARTSGVELFDLKKSALIAKVPLRRGRVASFGPDEKSIYTTSLDGLQVWPLAWTGAAPKFGGPEKIPTGNRVAYENLLFSPARRELLVWLNHSAVLLDQATRQPRFFIPHDYLARFAFSPDGRWLATGTFHGNDTRVWDAHTGTLLQRIGQGDGHPVFSPDGRWLANSQSTGCGIYDTSAWKLQRFIPAEAATGMSPAAAFSPTDNFLIYAARRRLLQLIDPETGKELASILPSEHHQVDKLAFSRDGNLLAVAMNDETVQTWNLQALRQELARLGLDWRQPAPPSFDLGPVRWVSATVAVCLLSVIALSIAGWFRHRQFVRAYLRIEALTEQQHGALRQAEAELFQSQKLNALGTLAAGIAHDFNNLLSVIRMSNRLTGEEAGANPEVQENVRIIERSVNQGKNVVRSMLGYSRSAGECVAYSVPEVVQATTQLLHHEFLRRVQVRIHADESLPRAFGVPNRLEQILLNIIINAAEAMSGSGSLVISVRVKAPPQAGLLLRPAQSGECLEMLVTDSGPGMPEEVRQRIFEPFYTTKEVGNDRGTGLGLSVVFTVAQAEGMGLAVESQVGQGTTFRIYIPIAPSEISQLPNPGLPAIMGL